MSRHRSTSHWPHTTVEESQNATSKWPSLSTRFHFPCKVSVVNLEVNFCFCSFLWSQQRNVFVLLLLFSQINLWILFSSFPFSSPSHGLELSYELCTTFVSLFGSFLFFFSCVYFHTPSQECNRSAAQCFATCQWSRGYFPLSVLHHTTCSLLSGPGESSEMRKGSKSVGRGFIWFTVW